MWLAWVIWTAWLEDCGVLRLVWMFTEGCDVGCRRFLLKQALLFFRYARMTVFDLIWYESMPFLILWLFCGKQASQIVTLYCNTRSLHHASLLLQPNFSSVLPFHRHPHPSQFNTHRCLSGIAVRDFTHPYNHRLYFIQLIDRTHPFSHFMENDLSWTNISAVLGWTLVVFSVTKL